MTHQPSLRQRVARAIHRYDYDRMLSGNDMPSKHHYGEADFVLAELRAELAASAVVPAADRAAVLGEAPDLADRLEAVLTKRFTALGNPFSEMRRQEKGPDGWPASRPVGPHQVAEVLRELVGPAVEAQPGKDTETQ
jgi:hypothetical protein